MNANLLKGIIFFLLPAFGLLAQEIEQFRLDDFNLQGPVKRCQVITDYGKEVFEFDELGRLLSVTTQYNEDDKDVTSYKYDNGDLIEKRTESYKNLALDLASSLAHLYSIDSTDHKIIREEIISYDKEFLETQEYHFDENNVLSKIVISHQDAVDEIVIEQTDYKKETTKTYMENGVILKSIRESFAKAANGEVFRVVLTKSYLDGDPNKAIEERFSSSKHLVSKELFLYSNKEDKFVSQEKHSYTYGPEGFLSKEITYRGTAVGVKEYVYQFDNAPEKNWVKQIVTPQNTYTTRRIEYYPEEATKQDTPN